MAYIRYNHKLVKLFCRRKAMTSILGLSALTLQKGHRKMVFLYLTQRIDNSVTRPALTIKIIDRLHILSSCNILIFLHVTFFITIFACQNILIVSQWQV